MVRLRTIHQNYKIKNVAGAKREFDVFIESEINGLTIKIAIECKDLNLPVSVEKIEAFKTKCDRIPSINKKIFISSKGFQRDAISAAKESGIELFVASQVDKDSVISWFPITDLDIKLLPGGHPLLLLDAEENEIQSIICDLSRPFLFHDKEIMINDHILETFRDHKTEILDLAVLTWSKLSEENRKNSFYIPVKWNPKNLLMVDRDRKIKVTGINMNYQFQFAETLVDTKESFDYSSLDGSMVAKVTTTKMDDETEANFVTTKDRKTTLHINGPARDRSNFRFVAFSPTETRIIKL